MEGMGGGAVDRQFWLPAEMSATFHDLPSSLSLMFTGNGPVGLGVFDLLRMCVENTDLHREAVGQLGVCIADGNDLFLVAIVTTDDLSRGLPQREQLVCPVELGFDRNL